MKKRNFIIAVLVSLSALSLVGCGSSKKEEAPAQKVVSVSDVAKEAENAEKEQKAKEEQASKEEKKNDSQATTDTKATTSTDSTTEKMITQEEGIEILKNGYITGGIDIAYEGQDTIDNHKLLKYYTMHSNEQGSTVIDTVLYVDGLTKKVYHHNNSGVLVETILKK